MTAFLFIAAALCGYLVGGFNPAIALSRAIYHTDIRTCGSGNPGFTNFKRSFGNRWAWWVLVLDLSKAALVVGLFAYAFGRERGAAQFGAVYTGLFAMLGHAFPVAYRFRGGKGFLVCLSTVWVADWRVGLGATCVMVVLLLTTKYMSLSTVTAMLLCPPMLALLGAHPLTVALNAAAAVFMAVRHRENFKRLRAGTESRFHLGGRS